jgi:sialic acid synthase SpsE
MRLKIIYKILSIKVVQYIYIQYISRKQTPIYYSTYVQPKGQFRQVYWFNQIVLF